MFRKRITLAAWLLSFAADHEKHHNYAIAFHQPPYITREKCQVHRESGSSGFPIQHGAFYTHASLRTSATRKPLDTTTSAPRRKFPKRNRRATRTKPRKLNSDIFYLRKQNSGIHLAEKRLEKAIADMIKENNEDGEDNISSRLQKRYQQQNQQQQDTEIPDDKLGQFPDIVSFHAVISSHAKNAHKDRLAAKRAIGLLERMQELSVSFPHLSPTIFSYNSVMEAYCNQADKNRNRVEYQQRLWEDQEVILRLYQELQENDLSPNAYTRNMILGSAPNDSEEWSRLETWACNYLDGNSDGTIPDRKTYKTLFRIYSLVGDADRAEKMLRKLLKWNASQDKDHYHSQKGLESTQTKPNPSKYWFDLVFKALAVSDSKCDELDERIEQLLLEMKDLVRSGHADLQPDTITYNHVLNVYAKHGNPKLALRLMKKMEESSNESDALDSVSYTTVIKSYARAQKKISVTETQSFIEMAEEATEIFERMRGKSIPPTILTCKSDNSYAMHLLQYWKLSPHSAFHIQYPQR